MFAFGYALVPLYKKICEITGINNITQKDDVSQSLNTQIDSSRTITVEFDANTTGPLRFRPVNNFVKIHPGELGQVTYEVVNALDRPVAVQAIPSYAPHNAAAHFKKLECFCFAQQTLAAKQAKQMPVVFVIDKTLPNNIDTITLSYTFFEVPGAKISELK
jgi:cytochrome c oxidase assembly protein subunit 11